jgi:DNA-binding transcriptional MocR family regulator
MSISADCLAITPGNSAALGIIFSNVALRRPRSSIDAQPYTAIVENPTYFLAGQMFADAGIETIAVGMDEGGLDVDAIAELCRAGSAPDFVYTITNFHNPTGSSLSAPRREQLLQLAEEHDFLIIADEPYNLLVFGDEPPPLPLIASASGCAFERVICLGSFSKLLAPGLRLGWMHASPALIGVLAFFRH